MVGDAWRRYFGSCAVGMRLADDAASEDEAGGDFWSGAALSIWLVGACLVAAARPGVFSVGVALSIAAVGGCFCGLA